MQNQVGQGQILQQPVYPQPQQCCYAQPQPVMQVPQIQTSYQNYTAPAPYYAPVPNAYMPNYATPPQSQAVQVPNYSGVNIQIFNPSVGTPGAAPVYNVNAPSYQTNPMGGANSGSSATATAGAGQGSNVNPNSTTNPDGSYPAGHNINNSGQNDNQASKTETVNTTTTETKDSSKKTEKRKIVELTDDYIKNLENYLNSQDAEVRLMGAKEVVARLQEDDSRCNDKALNALINKMIQDPQTKIRVLALSMLDARLATGDDTTVQVLNNMKNSPQAYGHDAVDAANILLKMSGKFVEKEFEVKETSKKTEKK